MKKIIIAILIGLITIGGMTGCTKTEEQKVGDAIVSKAESLTLKDLDWTSSNTNVVEKDIAKLANKMIIDEDLGDVLITDAQVTLLQNMEHYKFNGDKDGNAFYASITVDMKTTYGLDFVELRDGIYKDKTFMKEFKEMSDKYKEVGLNDYIKLVSIVIESNGVQLLRYNVEEGTMDKLEIDESIYKDDETIFNGETIYGE